ncbi:hypothetical protein DENSPDRAFT_121117 [Dentipellis sp. KUC8613]|nr:hypothetical protein DENSPDRAFT_121117 [Dentipellis sp. KUC8613]
MLFSFVVIYLLPLSRSPSMPNLLQSFTSNLHQSPVTSHQPQSSTGITLTRQHVHVAHAQAAKGPHRQRQRHLTVRCEVQGERHGASARLGSARTGCEDESNEWMWMWMWAKEGGERWGMSGGRWEVGGGRWEVGGGRCGIWDMDMDMGCKM